MMYESLTMYENIYQSTVNLWNKIELFLWVTDLQVNKYEW